MNAPSGLLTKAACRKLGMTRPDVDRMFSALPVVSLEGSARPYVRVEDYQAWLDRHTQPPPANRRAA